MADHFTERESTGFLGNMGKSIMAVPIGLLLFFASFFVFWKTEGRANWSKIGATAASVVVDGPIVGPRARSQRCPTSGPRTAPTPRVSAPRHG